MNFKAMLVATALVMGVATSAQAQVVIDMSLITCKEYMSADPERKELVASWMSGYFSASKNLNVLDFRYVARNKKVVENYCKRRPGETLMSAIRRNAR
jgi:acid stress chaperone HdeB